MNNENTSNHSAKLAYGSQGLVLVMDQGLYPMDPESDNYKNFEDFIRPYDLKLTPTENIADGNAGGEYYQFQYKLHPEENIKRFLRDNISNSNLFVNKENQDLILNNYRISKISESHNQPKKEERRPLSRISEKSVGKMSKKTNSNQALFSKHGSSIKSSSKVPSQNQQKIFNLKINSNGPNGKHLPPEPNIYKNVSPRTNVVYEYGKLTPHGIKIQSRYNNINEMPAKLSSKYGKLFTAPFNQIGRPGRPDALQAHQAPNVYSSDPYSYVDSILNNTRKTGGPGRQSY